MPESAGVPIMHVITGLPTGGAQMMLLKLLRATDYERWAPVVVSLQDRGDVGDQIESLGVPLHALEVRASLPNPAAVWSLRDQVLRYRPRLIQGWLPHGNLAALTARMVGRGRPRVVWNVRNILSPEHKKITAAVTRIGAAFSGRVDKVVYNSQRAARQFEGLGYAPHRTEVIPNGFDTDEFVPSQTARAALRRRLRCNDSTILVGLIGRFHPIKDHRNFLRAATLLCARFPQPRLVLAGAGMDSRNPTLRGWLKDAGIGSLVHLLGEVEDVASLMAGLDILCSASCAEGFPNVVGEAMACAVPCVVTDVGDSAWLVDDTGMAVPPRDPPALANALANLIEAGPDVRQRLGQAARQRIVDEFSLSAVSARYSALYAALLAGQTTVATAAPA